MNKALSKTEKDFIDRMGKISKKWGMSEPAGRVWGALLFSSKPLSQKEIAEKTGYTLSLVSPCLNLIEKFDMIKSARGKNKEKLYEPAISFLEGFRILIKRFVEQDIKPMIEELEDTKDVKSNLNLSKLIAEYKQLKRYLAMSEKMHLKKFGAMT